MSSDRQDVLSQRLAERAAAAAAAEEEQAAAPPAAVPASPPAPAAPSPGPAAVVPSQAPAPKAETEDDDDGRQRFTFYLDKELGAEFDRRADALFWDARGALSKGDIYSAVIRAGLEQWEQVSRELWANVKGAQ